MKTINLHLITIEPMLGISSANPDIYSDFIGDKAPDAQTLEEEIEAIGAAGVVEKGTTIFPRLPDGRPFYYDYQIKGFCKDTCGILRRVSTSKSSKLKNYKKVIDGLVYPQPRRIPIIFKGDITICQRPLRAQTMQGERIALSSSEQIPAGAELNFKIVCKDDSLVEVVEEWFAEGYWRGLGQWRNSGMGRFVYEILDDKGRIVSCNTYLMEEYE